MHGRLPGSTAKNSTALAWPIARKHGSFSNRVRAPMRPGQPLARRVRPGVHRSCCSFSRVAH
jgi:hypothetical protein